MNIPLRKSYDVEGYVTENGQIFCTGCVGDTKDCNSIVVGEEWDHFIYCEECGGKLEVNYIYPNGWDEWSLNEFGDSVIKILFYFFKGEK